MRRSVHFPINSKGSRSAGKLEEETRLKHTWKATTSEVEDWTKRTPENGERQRH